MGLGSSTSRQSPIPTPTLETPPVFLLRDPNPIPLLKWSNCHATGITIDSRSVNETTCYVFKVNNVLKQQHQKKWLDFNILHKQFSLFEVYVRVRSLWTSKLVFWMYEYYSTVLYVHLCTYSRCLNTFSSCSQLTLTLTCLKCKWGVGLVTTDEKKERKGSKKGRRWIYGNRDLTRKGKGLSRWAPF